MKAVKEKAYAKINLYLDVIAKRDDGFHDIKTVMHSISLSDELTVTYLPSPKTEIRLAVSGNRYIPTDGKNLAVKAALLFLERASACGKITITLKKNIPVAAGLAGGSSDAAAVLRAMNRLFDKMFTERALVDMASELGSDVPYCLYAKTALCEGRGEIITKLPDTLKLYIVVAIAAEHISTPTAYTELDKIYSDFDGSVTGGGAAYYAELFSAINRGELSQCSLFNIFEAAVLPKCPGASKIKELMLEYGAKTSLMSGSGPSVFGVFESEKSAKDAEKKLVEQGFNAKFAVSV